MKPFTLLTSAICLFALLIQAIRKAGVKKAIVWQSAPDLDSVRFARCQTLCQQHGSLDPPYGS